MPTISTSKSTGERFLQYRQEELTTAEQELCKEITRLRQMAREAEQKLEALVRAWPENEGKSPYVGYKYGKVSIGQPRANGKEQAQPKERVSLAEFWAQAKAEGRTA